MLGRWTLGRQYPKRRTLGRQRESDTRHTLMRFFNKMYSNMSKIYSNINKIYSDTLVNIQKSTTLLEDQGTLQRFSRRCGTLKRRVLRKHPSPNISSSTLVAALHVSGMV